tara:strand:+ start:1385 stop:1711 length:327 start_codon:yes stop_codon:yes gene_type:complete
MKRSKWTIELERKYGNKLKDKKISTLSKYFKIKKNLLDDVYDRGRQAGINTGMRKGVVSVDMWGRGRLNKYIIRTIEARKTGKVDNGRGQDGDLVAKALPSKKNITFI